MTGAVHLRLQRFADAFVLPASAVFSRGGKTYLLEVKDGVTRLVPVRVQVNDGTVAKVVVITRVPDARGGSREVLRRLLLAEAL